MKNRAISTLVIIILIVTLLGNQNILAASAAQETPHDLKINQLASPYGIPTENPSFSWVVSSVDNGNSQNAYQILIASSKANIINGIGDVYDTGRVFSNECSDVRISSLRLNDDRLYYWTVRIWCGGVNASDYAVPETFTTAVGSDWSDNQAIWSGISDTFADSGWDNYIASMDLRIDYCALGVLFRSSADGSKSYMCRLDAQNNELDIYNCSTARDTLVSSTSLADKGLLLQYGTYFHIDISVCRNSISVSLNSVPAVLVSITDNPITAGTVGFRTGSGESGSCKNISINRISQDYSVLGPLYSDNFKYGCNMFTGGTVTNGELKIGEASTFTLADTYSDKTWSSYAINFDMNITSQAAAVCFRVSGTGKSYYMWQFDTEKNAMIPYRCDNGVFTQLGTVSLKDKKIMLKKGQYIHVQITADGNTVTTCIAEKTVDVRSAADFSSGIFGFRTGSKESSLFKNIRVNRIDKNGKPATTIFCDSFLGGVNDFAAGCVAGGQLNLGNSSLALVKLHSAEETGDFVFLRSEFNIDGVSKISKAIVSVTASSPLPSRRYVYNLYLNGSFVGLGPEQPVNNEIRYNTYDVTALIKNGVNAIGAINYTTAGKQFLLQLKVFYNDGTSSVIVNSGRDADSWKALDGTAVFRESGSIGTGYYIEAAENIDATVFPYGWNEPGFDDTDWKSPEFAGSIASDTLKPSEITPDNRVYQPAATVICKGKGNYFIDLGKEVIGGLCLTVGSDKIQDITIRSGEECSAPFTVKYNLRASNTYEEKWRLNIGKQTIENLGLKTFRYVEILNSPVAITADNIKSVSIRQPFDENESSFSSSSKIINDIYNLSKYTVEETNQQLYVDSQSRERKAYEGDALLNMLASYSVSGDSTLARYSTEYLMYNRTWPAEYKLYSVMLAYNDYMYTGNRSIIEEYYTKLRQDKLFDELFDDRYGLLKNPTISSDMDRIMVDWPTSELDGYRLGDCMYNTAFNAVAYGAYLDIAQIAQALGQNSDAEYYNNRAARIKTAMLNLLYSSSDGAFYDGLDANGSPVLHCSQQASAFALAFGIADSSNTEIQQKVAAYIGNAGLKTSVYGSFFVMSALYNSDADGAAFNMLTGDSTHSWSHMMYNLGATLTTEDWDPSLKSNMTFSHPWGAGVAYQITSGIFGIKPLKAGFDEFQVKFHTAGLQNAGIKVPTVKGTISASFDKASAIYSITVPNNTKASVYLPAQSAALTITINGTQQVLAAQNGYVMVELESGTHQIQVK